jgi:DNA-binding response OmpR family regulator
MRVLIVEDEVRLAQLVKKGLIEEGFAVDLARDGEEGKYMAEINAKEYDLIMLDVDMPKIDGLTLCRHLRDQKNNTPILMLSALSSLEDRVRGLDCGADDYLTKPFAFRELYSRIHALIRRSKQEKTPTLKIADLTMDPIRHSVSRSDQEIKLTPKEFSILEFLLRHKNSLVTRTMLIEHVWDYNFDSLSNVVDVFVASLRRKVDRGQKIKLIKTIHGVGYKISE